MLLLLSILAISSAAAICPASTDNYITDLCYKIVTTPATFDDARQSCHSQGYSLAVLHSGVQGNFLASLVNSATGTNDNIFWIGLQRATPGSKFYWDDGSSMYWTYWASGFPNGNNQAAVSTINARWKTLDAFEQHVYVCSYDPKKPLGSTIAGPTGTPAYSTVPPSFDSTTQGVTGTNVQGSSTPVFFGSTVIGSTVYPTGVTSSPDSSSTTQQYFTTSA